MNPKYLNILKRKKKYIRLYTRVVPRKRNKTENKASIQEQFINSMKTLQKRQLTGALAVQIITYTTDRNTPNITEWTKNIIDILHKRDYLQDPADALFLPFIDDKQIKYLYSCYEYQGEYPLTIIMIQPFSSFISDLHLINTYQDKDVDREMEWEKMHDLKVNKEEYLKIFSEEAYEIMLKLEKAEQQKYIGESLAISRFLITTLYPKRGVNQKYFKDLYIRYSKILLDSPLRIALPGIPKGGSKDKTIVKNYRQELKKLLEEYKDRIPIFNKIIHPMIATIIYRPARKSIRKDIDNILLEYILPVVNKVFVPPASPYRMTEINSNSIPLSKDLNGLCIGYEILEIPRSDDVPNGDLYLGFKFDLIRDPLMDQTEKFIEKYLKGEFDQY